MKETEPEPEIRGNELYVRSGNMNLAYSQP